VEAQAGGLIRNLTMTTAIAGQEAFISAADLAYMQVSTGTMSYTQAIREAVKSVASQGLSVIQYAGRKDQLDVAMRRAVLTGVGQTTGKLQMARADEMGCDLVQTSAHAGARPAHQVWQGQVFSRSGKSREYPNFVESTGYGTPGGLNGINCRHSWYPFFEGISENAYTERDVQALADKKVNYQGREITQYEASQVQREIERKIRKAKREASALDAVQDRLAGLITAAGIVIQLERPAGHNCAEAQRRGAAGSLYGKDGRSVGVADLETN